MKSLKKIKEKICDELDEIADKDEWSAGTLDTVDKLTHSLKSILTVDAMDNGGYSSEPYPRYTERYHDSRYDDRYSRSDLADKLRDMLHEASSEKERTAIKECLNKMER